MGPEEEPMAYARSAARAVISWCSGHLTYLQQMWCGALTSQGSPSKIRELRNELSAGRSECSPLSRHQGNEARSALARLRHRSQIIAGETMRRRSPSFAVVAALIGGLSLISVGFASPSPVLAQTCFRSADPNTGTPTFRSVPCPPQVTQGPAGVSQAAALGSLSLLTATANSTNTN